MEFIVTRTSIHDNTRPCWEATSKAISVDWLGQKIEKNVWVVEFNNLQELIEFKNKYGSVVIDNYVFDSNLMHIEIYDSYRE